MIYKFKSRSDADVIMLEHNGDQMLKIIGRKPSAQGIVTVAQIPAAIAALQAAAMAQESAEGGTVDCPPAIEPEACGNNVSLRTRVGPLIALLRNSVEAGEDVVWGV